MSVPSNLIPTRITQLPQDPSPSDQGWLIYVNNGTTYRVQAADILSLNGVPVTRQVIAGTGLAGGGQLADDVTLSVAPGGIGSTELDATGVTPGTYGNASTVPVFTVDANGRVTAAGTASIVLSGYVPETRQVLAGDGLSGGGALTGDITLTADLSSATPLTGINAGATGVSTEIARADHQHPAVDLADQTQINGILPVDQGGTGKSLVPNAGAIVWSGADGLYIGPAGALGQVLVSGANGEYTWGSIATDAPMPANYVFAGPAAGPDAFASFRLLVNADIPTALSGKTIDNSVIGGSVPAAGTFTSVDTDYVDFAPALSPLPTNQTGRVYYDGADQFQTIVFQMNGNVVQHVGEEQFYRIRCQGAIGKGQVVAFAGTLGASGGLVGKAATGLLPEQSNYVLGVADESGADNDWIFVTSFGEVKNIDTSAWAQGDVLYYDPTVVGGLTNAKPTVPNAITVVAAVVNVGVSNGIIFVRPTYGNVFGGTDVNAQFSSLTNNDMVVYNATNSRWENYAPSATRTALGLGTIATQNANSVDIDGGSIDGTTIGANSAAAGTFTTVTATSGISGGTF